jgi:hypothetical protein
LELELDPLKWQPVVEEELQALEEMQLLHFQQIQKLPALAEKDTNGHLPLIPMPAVVADLVIVDVVHLFEVLADPVEEDQEELLV